MERVQKPELKSYFCSMKQIILILSGFLFFSVLTFAQDNQSGKCGFCDTNYYYTKPLGGELKAAYPEQIICYFSDTLGNKSTKKCTLQRFTKGNLNGSELGYYYSEKVYLVNWFGRRYKHPIKPWRKKIFASEMPDYSLEYKGYWKNGEKNGFWTYYDRDGKIVLVLEYKDGVLVE